MGCTHYWTQTRPATPEEWRAITQGFKTLVGDTKAPLTRDLDDPSPPEITDERIWFNGKDEETGYETMHVTRTGGGFNFCKTGRHEYDKWVVALLIIMDGEAPHCWTITSDGDRDDEWREVMQWLNGLGVDCYEIPKGVT